MRRTFFPLLLAVLVATMLAGWFGLERSRAADPALQSDNWVQHLNYDPPNASHVKTELTGSQATPLPGGDGKILLKGVRIKQFALSGGEPQMVAEAPECIYDRRHQLVSSAGALQVRAQQGKFFVEGNGFTFDQAQSSLLISNNAHSLLQIQATNAAGAPLTEVFAHQAHFEMRSDATNGVAIYQGTVRIVDPKMKMTAEILTAVLPKDAAQTNRVNHILVETNVVIDFVSDSGEPIHATGDKAVYTSKAPDGSADELLELTGTPRVELTNGWMTADVFTMNRTVNKLHGNGKVHLHYLAESGGTNHASVNAGTELFAQQFEFNMTTRVVEFWTGVRVEDARVTLNAEWVTAVLPKREAGHTNQNHIEHMLALTNVVIDMPTDAHGQAVHATGQKADYNYKVANSITNDVLQLTGNPAVQTTSGTAAGWMTADDITVDRAQGRIWGTGNHHFVFKRDAHESAAMDTEVFSDRFDYADQTGLVVYHDNVRAYDPTLNVVAKTLEIKLAKHERGSTATNKLENIRADGDVVIEILEQAFSPADITNLTAFSARLQQPTDPVTQFVVANLSAPTRKFLANYTNGANAELRLALATDLNHLVQRGGVYNAERFSKVYLSIETTDLLQKQPLGVELVELNRLLLLDAFRGMLARGQKGEIAHATGEHATYDYVLPTMNNHEVLVLTGHPRVEQPNRWLTADDSIVYDRTTRQYHGVGNFQAQAKLLGLKNYAGSPRKTK